MITINSGCGLRTTVNRMRLDYIAQGMVSQARDEVMAPAGDYQRAQALAQRALDLAPASPLVVRTAAEVFMMSKAWDRALGALLLCQSRTGEIDMYAVGAAYVYSKQEAAGTPILEAYVASQRSLQATHRIGDEELAAALNNAGYVFADAGVNLPRALELTREAVRLRPENANFADRLAWACDRLARYEEAAFYAERAVRLSRPPHAEILYHAGAIHARQGRLMLAENELRRALTLQPCCPEARYELQRLRW